MHFHLICIKCAHIREKGCVLCKLVAFPQFSCENVCIFMKMRAFRKTFFLKVRTEICDEILDQLSRENVEGSFNQFSSHCAQLYQLGFSEILFQQPNLP